MAAEPGGSEVRSSSSRRTTAVLAGTSPASARCCMCCTAGCWRLESTGETFESRRPRRRHVSSAGSTRKGGFNFCCDFRNRLTLAAATYPMRTAGRSCRFLSCPAVCQRRPPPQTLRGLTRTMVGSAMLATGPATLPRANSGPKSGFFRPLCGTGVMQTASHGRSCFLRTRPIGLLEGRAAIFIEAFLRSVASPVSKPSFCFWPERRSPASLIAAQSYFRPERSCPSPEAKEEKETP